MKPEKTNNNKDELFKSALSNQLRQDHELKILADKIALEEIEEAFSSPIPYCKMQREC